jgi:hypothetical protein
VFGYVQVVERPISYIIPSRLARRGLHPALGEAISFESTMNNPTEIELAYIAGVMDGEGCVTILRQKFPRKFQYRLFLVVSNTNEEVIRYLHNILGCGAVHPLRRTQKRDTHMDVWQWQASFSDAYSVLTALYPYLIVKRRDALIAMEFYKLPPNNYARIPDPFVESERERLYFSISDGRVKNKKRKRYAKL